MFKSEFSLSFGQIGLITLTYQITASLLQPLVGLYTDTSEAVFTPGRHGIYAVRLVADVDGRELPGTADRRSAGRMRVVDISS
ncbi:MAG: Fosmidomycin resistance protein [uncultured Caballeronia sp.]|nr:MAG: Fosmidomycin resistance protein [uncultured Caballeronia sp.]